MRAIRPARTAFSFAALAALCLAGFAGQTLVEAASAADPVIGAAGDVACSSSSSNYNGGNGTADKCRQKYTSDLLVNAGLSSVLVLGDSQYESASLSGLNNSYGPTWGRVKSISRPAAGNHEYKTANASGYFDYFNGVGVATGPAGDRTKGYYSFNVGTWHLIALNSTDHCTIVPCGVGSAQETWLKADLAANSSKYCTLAYWHDPRFNSGHDGNADEMQPLFQALYNADADVILGGHAHDYERFAPQNPSGQLDNTRGIRQFVVGTGGAFFTSVGTAKPNSQVRQNNTYGVLKLTLHPASYDWQFVSESNKPFTDSGTGQCHGSQPPPPADTTKPTVPGNLAATASAGQVALSWTAATDNVGVTGYKVYRGGTEIASLGNVTSYADTTVAGSTTYSYTVRAVDAAGNLSDPSNAATATTPATTSFTIPAEADARVQQSSPTTNYATSNLRTDNGTNAATDSFLRFTVGGVVGGVQDAKLRIHAYTATVDGPAVYTTSNSWAENTLNWNNRPLRTSAATDDKGAIASNTWVEYNVTPFVTGNGTYSFTIAQTSSDGVDFRSREYTANRPELVLTTGVDSQKPTPPGSLNATAGAGQVALSWQSASDNVAVTGYRVYRGTTQIASLGASATSHADTGLAPGPYSYTVKAIDAAQNLSDASNTASATVPDTTKPTPPGNLQATAGTGQVALTWQASTDNVGVTGYRVYRGTAEVASLGATATSWTNTGLAPGPYSYTVKAIDAAQNLSDPSNTASATVPDTTKPTPPGNLQATAGTGQVALTWQASTDNVGVTEYRVFRGTAHIATVGSTATSYTDTGLAAGPYSYTVKALDAAQNASDGSNTASATVPDTSKPSAPPNLQAVAGSSIQVDLTWDESTDDVAVTHYKIYRDGNLIATVDPTTSYSDTVLPGTYSYVVRADDAATNLSDPSNTATVTVTPLDVEAPTAPGNLTANAVGGGQADLAWDASSDNVAVTGYRIYRDGQPVATIDPATSYSDLVAPGDYTYVVRALDAGHESGPSNEATVTVPDMEDPTPPANLAATAVSPSQIDLAWNASSDNVEVTSYQIYRDDALLATIDPATAYSDSVIAPATHKYEVRALDAAGNVSAFSNSDTATVTVPDTDAPLPPGNLTAVQTSTDHVDLGWDPATDNVAVTEYRVYRDDQLLATIGATTTYRDATVVPGSHSYQVKAADEAQNVSEASNTADITVIDTQLPTTPGNLAATPVGSSRIDLAWEASTDSVGVTGYEIYRDDSPLTTVGPSTTYSDPVLAPATHRYEVRALDAAGNRSGFSNPATASVVPPDSEAPTIPANLQATGSGNGDVDLTWDASFDNVGVTAYRVYRGTAEIASVSGTTTSFTDTGRPPGDYSYTVKAVDAAGNLSDASNTASATVPDSSDPTAPTQLGATAVSPTQIDLSWQASSDDVGVTAYRIYRGGGQIATIGPTTSYSDTSVTAGNTYSYEVRALDGAGHLSGPSNTATATSPAPTVSVTLSPEADSEVNAGAPTTNYATSKLRADGGSTPEESVLRFTVNGVTAGTVRSAKLRVHAYTATVDGPGVFTTATSWSETTVNWNTRPTRTSVLVDDKGAIPANTWVEYDVTPFVTGSGTYSFGLAMSASDGVDFRSREYATNQPELVIDAGPPDTETPTPPAGLNWAAPSPTRVDLSWQASTDNVAVTGYRIYRGGAQVGSVGGTTTLYSDTTVTAGSTSTYEVRAVDAAGNVSDASNSVTATTPAAATVLALSPEADARVHAASPTTNYGTSYLRANGGTEPAVESFLRFTVSGAPAGVTSAKLRLYATNGTVDGPAIYTTATTWTETAINWNTRPARTSGATDDKGAIPVNTWVEYDVKPFVSGNGTYSFTLATTSTDGVDFNAREAATLRPELVVTLP